MRTRVLQLLLFFGLMGGQQVLAEAAFPVSKLSDDAAFSLQRLDKLVQCDLILTIDSRPIVTGKLVGTGDFDFLLIMLVFVIMVIALARQPQYVQLMIRSVANYPLSIQFSREQSNQQSISAIIFMLLFNLNLAILVFEFIPERSVPVINSTKGFTLGLLFLILTVLYLGKFLLYRFFGNLFRLREAVSYYLSEVFLINRVMGLIMVVMLPFVLFAFEFLSNFTSGMMLILLVIGLLWRYYFAIRHISHTFSAYVFHFILYFCAVEIIPTAAIVKFLLNV